MFFGINEIAVIVTTLLALALGSIWYSPFLFGKAWIKAAGLTERDIEGDGAMGTRQLIISGIAMLVLMFVLAHAANLAETLRVALFTIGGYLALLATAVIATIAVAERKQPAYVLVHALYISVVIVVGLYIISLWPW